MIHITRPQKDDRLFYPVRKTLLKVSRRVISIGDIAYTRFWLSIEFRPNPVRSYRIGKTYNGTKRGLIVVLKRAVLIAHHRDVHAFD